MPRQARVIVPGFPHHIVQRGHNRQPVFVERRDYEYYLAGRQTRFVNALEKRSGSLWEGRYKISPIDTDAYLLACCRYVELNPVKAGMVEKAKAYEWSSYSARVGLLASDWLDESDSFRALAVDQQARIEAYRQFVEQHNGSPADVMIQEAINSNKLTGGQKFVDDIETRIGIRVEARKPGRPTTQK